MFDVAAFGPFVGDWKTEVFIFRPFIKWVTENINIDKVYISSHSNRLFLYDWIIDEHRIPVYEDLSRDEISQKGFLHKNITKSDYSLISKVYRDDVSNLTNCYVNYFPINYTRFFQYPFYCRYYTPIKSDSLIKKDDYILFIPDFDESLPVINELYNFLYKMYKNKLVVCGDMKTHLNEKNILLSKKNYFKCGYENIISYINNAKAVICPMSFWTFLVNMQNIPVYSWSTDDMNKIYRNLMTNNKHMITQERNPEKIVQGFNEFLNKI